MWTTLLQVLLNSVPFMAAIGGIIGLVLYLLSALNILTLPAQEQGGY
ncbi:MAG: hypothetical protein FWE99_03200 [Bacteroidales bacterium]|nr:hypothetical protein [Bacteroidales bacterium]